MNTINKLMENAPAHIINGKEYSAIPGSEVISMNPYTGKKIWESKNADFTLIEKAMTTAAKAKKQWRSTPFEERKKIVEQFTLLVKSNEEELTQLVAQEAGKPYWESKVEVNALTTKLTASLDAYEDRCSDFGREVNGRQSRTRFVPHGVMVVLGPYNFPLSMANGHIMPSLLAGNTVVFKPSELTPLAGIYVSRLWQKAGLPKGVLNCVSGNGVVGEELVNHSLADGVLFVGSHPTGINILKSLVEHPEKIVALEMGGNSPLVINDVPKDKIDAVVALTIQSAFISSGQRCSAARRLIVHSDLHGYMERLIKVSSNLLIGDVAQDPQPFYGSMIRPEFVQKALDRFDSLKKNGGKALLEPTVSGPNNTVFSPGIIDMSKCTDDLDEEIFGPILKVYFFNEVDEAVVIANDTKFGLAAGIVSEDRAIYEEFYNSVKTGIINWNQPLTGATTFAPFGGVGQSGNFRPAGFLAADYCSYPIASFETEVSSLTVPNINGLNL